MVRLRAIVMAAGLSLTLSSCSGSDGPTGPPSGATDRSETPNSGGSGTAGSSTAGSSDGNVTGPTMIGKPAEAGGHFLNNFPMNQIMDGGVGKDGIPALTDPPVATPNSSEASYVRDEDLVLGVVINGEPRAYPHNIGWWNEIVNDVVGGHPISVTFCPLTGTGLVFNGQSPTGRVELGVSGLLFNNNLIMYDRRDGETLYPQMTYKGVTGPRSGQGLELMPVVETTWRYWKRLYPGTTVVSGSNGVYPLGQYTQYPYGDYRVPSTSPLFPLTGRRGPSSNLFADKHLALGVRVGELAKAYPFPNLGDQAVINDSFAEQEILVVWYAHEQLAIPYDRRVDGQILNFIRVASTDPLYPFMVRDEETSTTWNLKGVGVDGPLKGKRLEQVPAHNAFWFAWSTFWQNTGVY